MHPVAAQLDAIRTELNASFYERSDVIESMILALVAGEHHFVVGPPGTSKSRLVRALISALKGATYFEAGLSKNRPAEAILGPLDIPKFREGEYKLKRAGFATDVDILFLDELGKMSPTLGHDLLGLYNERVYYEVNGGRSVHPAPLHTAFSASNEMPTGESEDAAALWDRLLVRVIVDYLQDKASFAKLLTEPVSDPVTTVEFEDVKTVTRTIIPTVALTNEIVQSLVKLRMRFAAEHLYPSDRRWRASVKVLQAAAFLAGRTEVTEDDLAVLRFTLWDTPEQVEKVNDLCQSAANPYVATLLKSNLALREIQQGMKNRADQTGIEKGEYGKEVNTKLLGVRNDLDDLLRQANGRQIPGFKATSDMCLELNRAALIEFLGTSEDVVEVVLAKRNSLGDGGNLT